MRSVASIMAAAVLGEARQLLGSASDGYGHCCPPVFDPYTLVALIGGIALATYFLRIVIVTSTIMGRSWVMDSPFGEIGGSCMNISFKCQEEHYTKNRTVHVV